MQNGQGGLDWDGVPLVVELLGPKDLEQFMHNLITIKLHRPPDEKNDMTPEGQT